MGKAQISAAFRDVAPKPASVPQIAPRDAITVLSVKGATYHYRRAPSEGHTENLTV
jgi:hypothetical protein